MAAITELLNPALWREWLSAGGAELGYSTFWLAAVQIVFINALLSGDNAIAIAMACHGLPQPQRRWGIVIGTALAALLRIVFTAVFASLMLLPYLKLIGGAALLYISAKLLVPDGTDKNEIQAVAHLWRAVVVVVVADIVMSFDNVVAIAAVAAGDYFLLVIGLLISIPLLIAGAALIAALLERFPVLVWLGGALLGYIGGETMATDPAVASWLAPLGDAAIRQVTFAGGVAGAALAIASGGLWWRLHESHARAGRGRAKTFLIGKFFQMFLRKENAQATAIANSD